MDKQEISYRTVHRQYYLGGGRSGEWESGVAYHSDIPCQVEDKFLTWVGESVCYVTPDSHCQNLPLPK